MAMRFRAHDTFFIRKGWLSKGMKHIVEKPGLFVDKTENPMDVLGIGANMVKSYVHVPVPVYMCVHMSVCAHRCGCVQVCMHV